jgi:NAD(P)-dependent dehydrogenase (short-subunit alcohol dehydrogenase family)
MNPVTATLSGLRDLRTREARISGLAMDERIDGKFCLVTGANAGLGKAVAIELARRGGQVIMACRSGIPDAGEEVKRASGSDAVEMVPVDLADLNSVHALCNGLKERGVTLDRVILNAGLMPRRARKTVQGFEVMFCVHFLANRLLLARFIEDGVIRPMGSEGQPERPRIIFVASESHRSAGPIDFDHFGEFMDYGLRDGMAQYASSKLHLCTLASELSRRLNPADEIEIAVHSLCPGPINSNIARESPGWLGPLLKFVMKVFFRSPEVAAEPVVYLACSRELEGKSGAYLHMMREKTISEAAQDPENGRLLWEKSAELLKREQ